MPNSFLITQSKKLLGSGFLDKNISDKTLWLPAKLSKLSSIESSTYLNNLSSQLFKTSVESNSFKVNNLNQAFLQNINFFENSRLWLFKKFFFTNNQQQGLVVDYPQLVPTSGTKTIPTPLTFQFYTSLYVNVLLPLGGNPVNPSLSILKTTKNSTNTLTRLNGLVSLTTPQLDVLGGNTLNFIGLITSNPKQTFSGSSTYFNIIYFSQNISECPRELIYHT
jgi:hypothetical protein